MTHPTDEELESLVKRMESVSLQVGIPSRTALDSDVIRKAAYAITTLRAQLAEMQIEKEKLGREVNIARYGQPDFSWQIHKEALAEANARVKALEDALRAQVTRARETALREAAAALRDVADHWDCGHDMRYCNCAEHIEQWRFAEDEVLALIPSTHAPDPVTNVPECTDCVNNGPAIAMPTLADALQVPRIVTFHTAGRFGVCIGGRWDGWVMVQHPDGYWVSHHKPDPVDPSIPALRAIGEGEA